MAEHDQPYILCGLGKVGGRVLEHLRAAGVPVSVIDAPAPPDSASPGDPSVIVGDCRAPATLERAGVRRARGVLILTSDDLTNLSTALVVRNLNPTVRIVVRLFNKTLIAWLDSAFENIFALSTSALAGPMLALIARTGEAHGAFDLGNGGHAQVVELTVTPDSPLAGRDLAEVAQQHDAAVVVHRLADGTQRCLHEATGPAVLAAGDQLVLCGDAQRLEALRTAAGSESLPVLWAGFVRRFSRVGVRGLATVDTSLKVCTAVLLGVICLSVLVLHFGREKSHLPDAFYQTISLMATGAEMHGEGFEPGAWQKLFISSLRLVGMVLTAAFTAIFTNYLIRANLGGAFAVRRIPDSGHVIVCGLGNVGLRAVEELHRQGEPVVVIERQAGNAFVPAVRRLGIPVIIGNAAVAEVLQQARAASARAVVAASSTDLLNLEIALVVRALAPRQRVVVRLADPNLARTLRTTANVQLALSVPGLAAPAFVARLLGEHVRGLFFAAGQLLIVYDLHMPAVGSPLTGRPLGALAAEFHFAAVRLSGADGIVRPLAATSVPMPGEKLTIILAQPDLQRLMQHAAAGGPASA